MSRQGKIAGIVIVTAGAAGVSGVFVGSQRYRAANPGVVTLDEAWDRVRVAPRDPAAWAALADAQSAMDELVAAEASYENALRLGSQDATVRGRLGFLLYGRGKDERARGLLEKAAADGADLPMLDFTLDKLRATREEIAETNASPAAELETPTVPAPPSTCVVPLERSGARGVFRVRVQAGDVVFPLVVDTGASLTTIEESHVADLGLEVDPERRINAITATGPAEFPIASLAALSLEGRMVENLTVAVCQGCGGRETWGLLGLDAQSALGVELETSAARLRFVGCDDD